MYNIDKCIYTVYVYISLGIPAIIGNYPTELLPELCLLSSIILILCYSV